MAKELPDPKCPMGYPEAQLKDILFDRINNFNKWMTGQTVGVCDGRRYNYDTKEYEPTECADKPHGAVVYRSDLQSYLAGKGNLD